MMISVDDSKAHILPKSNLDDESNAERRSSQVRDVLGRGSMNRGTLGVAQLLPG